MKTNQKSDYELVREFVSGSQVSLEVLIHRHRKRIYTYIILLVKDQHLAEDIFQETFYKVIRSLKDGKYRDNGKFISWVLRIAHNLIIDHFRKGRQLNTYSNDDYESDIFNLKKLSDKTIEQNMVENQIAKDIRRLIQELPDDQREVVVLRHYCGLSFKEIADHTNVSINTALGRMRYALINLRKLIKERNLSLTEI